MHSHIIWLKIAYTKPVSPQFTLLFPSTCTFNPCFLSQCNLLYDSLIVCLVFTVFLHLTIKTQNEDLLMHINYFSLLQIFIFFHFICITIRYRVRFILHLPFLCCVREQNVWNSPIDPWVVKIRGLLRSPAKVFGEDSERGIICSGKTPELLWRRGKGWKPQESQYLANTN